SRRAERRSWWRKAPLPGIGAGHPPGIFSVMALGARCRGRNAVLARPGFGSGRFPAGDPAPEGAITDGRAAVVVLIRNAGCGAAGAVETRDRRVVDRAEDTGLRIGAKTPERDIGHPGCHAEVE